MPASALEQIIREGISFVKQNTKECLQLNRAGFAVPFPDRIAPQKKAVAFLNVS